ncbi:hypothetical protein [Enterococcus malodoratus]|uniref:hypothetical protein n=1 Tax=Enterococcus malodoratus TaxID=71451 RepID=UPI00207483D7|nr:hypothetical protein [Enterococcus malodoratus]
MEEYGLSKRQIFTLKRRSLEKRINKYYQQTNDGEGTIELLITLQVRDELCDLDFSFMLSQLVKRIFTRTRSTAALRRYYVYFAEYFDKKEWRLLLVKLFPAKTLIAEKLEQLYTQYIKAPLARLAGS